MKLSPSQNRIILNPQGSDQEALMRTYFAWKSGTGHDYLGGEGDMEVVLRLALAFIELHGNVPQKSATDG